MVCADKDLQSLVRTIVDECHTGERGDGMVFVTDVSDAMRIRTGAHGEEALRAA